MFNETKFVIIFSNLLLVISFTEYSLGKPLPPQTPFTFTSVTANEITLSWKPPLNDGGSRILSYTVEKREEDRDVWHSGAESRDLSATLTALKKGKSYMFRVR